MRRKRDINGLRLAKAESRSKLNIHTSPSDDAENFYHHFPS